MWLCRNFGLPSKTAVYYKSCFWLMHTNIFSSHIEAPHLSDSEQLSISCLCHTPIMDWHNGSSHHNHPRTQAVIKSEGGSAQQGCQMPWDRSDLWLPSSNPIILGEWDNSKTQQWDEFYPVLWELRKEREIRGRLESGRASQGLRRGNPAHEEKVRKGWDPDISWSWWRSEHSVGLSLCLFWLPVP